MKNFTRILALSLCFILCASLFSCTGQKKKTEYEIGICQLVEHKAHDEATRGFKDAVSSLLGEENVTYYTKNAQNDMSLCSSIVNQFVSDDVDLILANATAVLQTASSATSEIPILGTSITEYGAALDIKSFNGTVGGNISGTSDLAPLDAQAKMILEWAPDAKKVGIIYCSAEANSIYQVTEITKHLKKLGVEAVSYPFADTSELTAVCTSAAENTDIIYVPTDNTVASSSGIIDNICRPLKKLVIAGEENTECAIASLSISYYDMGYTTGEMAVRILKGGENISEMPIEYAKAAKKYNKELCDVYGITPPEGYTEIED